MSFLAVLKERIRQQFGPGHFREDDFSFLQPGGNDHLVQFLYKNYSDEYWELDDWNRNHLLLIDIAESLDIEFKLDDDGLFAVLQSPGNGETRQVQAIIDLRDELLAIVYYFGEAKKCLRLNQRLIQSPIFHPCYLDSEMLVRIVEVFERVIGIEYDFEQLPALFLEPVVMKGQMRGDPVHGIFVEYSRRFSSYLNICVISGYLTDGAQGSLTLNGDGAIRTDSCRLSSFIEIVGYVLDILIKKYQTLSQNCLTQWSPLLEHRVLELTGKPIEIRLPFSVEKIDGLIRFLVNGTKDPMFLGISERISRKLWSIKSTEIRTTEQIEFEVAEDLIRVFLRERGTIPLYDKVEKFLRQHVSAHLENWNQ
ncbi:hypothetical protein KKI24_17855 [bacterium]|nr:hypothetical protein [bacterium]